MDDKELLDEYLRNAIAQKRATGMDAARAEQEARADYDKTIRNASGKYTDQERTKWLEDKRDELIARGTDAKAAQSAATKAFDEMLRKTKTEPQARKDFLDGLRTQKEKEKADNSVSDAQKKGQKIATKALWNTTGQKILSLGWDAFWNKNETFCLMPILDGLPKRILEIAGQNVVPDIVADLKSKAPYEIHGRDFELFVSKSVEGSFQFTPALKALGLDKDGDKALEKLGMQLTDTPANKPADIPLRWRLAADDNPRFKWDKSFGGNADVDWAELAKGRLPKALKGVEGNAEISAIVDSEIRDLNSKLSIEGALRGTAGGDLKTPEGEKGNSYRFLIQPKFYERHVELKPEAELKARFEASAVTLSLSGNVKTTINREALTHHLKYEWGLTLEAEFRLEGDDERRARRERLLDEETRLRGR